MRILDKLYDLLVRPIETNAATTKRLPFVEPPPQPTPDDPPRQ